MIDNSPKRPTYELDEAIGILTELVPERRREARGRASAALVDAFVEAARLAGFDVDKDRRTIGMPPPGKAVALLHVDEEDGAGLVIKESSGELVHRPAPVKGLAFIPSEGRFAGRDGRGALVILAEALLVAWARR